MQLTARVTPTSGQHSTHQTIEKSVHSVSLADKCTLKTTDYRLQTRPRSLDLIVSRHSQRGMVTPTLHKSTWPTFRSTSWIMRNKPSMRVRRVIMRADGDEGSREMEARVKTWRYRDIR